MKRLREMFCSTWSYVESIKNLPENINRKFTIRIPEEQQEFLALSTTDMPNVFVADCITAAVKAEVKTDVSTMSELDFETFEPREDKNLTIVSPHHSQSKTSVRSSNPLLPLSKRIGGEDKGE